MAKTSITSSTGDKTSIYFLKLVTKVLGNLKGSYGDAYLLLEIATDSGLSHGAWFNDLNERLEEAEDHSNYSRVVMIREFVDKTYLAEVMQSLRDHRPELFEPIEPMQTSRTMAELLDLNEFETKLLDLSARFADIGYSSRHILESADTMFRDKDHMYAELLDEDVSTVKKAMEGILIQSGILCTEGVAPNGFFAINDDMRAIFSSKSLEMKDIDRILFPSMLETELGLDDYKHFEKDIKWCTELIDRNHADRAKGRKTKGTNILLWGQPGCGKTELAIALAAENGWDLKVIGDISPEKMSENSRQSRLASLKMATKMFRNQPNTVLLFDEMEDLFKFDNNATFSKAFINRIIETTEVPIIWTTNSLPHLGQPVLRRMLFNIEFDIPDADARAKIWKRYSELLKVKISDEVIDSLAQTYPIAPALISNAMNVAKTTFGRRKVKDEDMSEIVSSLYRLVNFGEGIDAKDTKKKKNDTYDASCSNTDQDLEVLANRLLNAPNKGFSLCLYGAPGTGKSEYGRYIAEKMGKEVLFKRASDLQSMWVGECEKNIAKAFKEAATSGKVLIIDEGDSFLRDREKARASWEISQVNEMLSQMETHTQPFILTTNLMKDIDSAALRRFTFKTEFRFMEPQQARKLFKKFFGVEAPRALDRNPLLAPGDFANVKRQCDILGIKDAEEIWRMVDEETKLKPNRRATIGFG